MALMHPATRVLTHGGGCRGEGERVRACVAAQRASVRSRVVAQRASVRARVRSQRWPGDRWAERDAVKRSRCSHPRGARAVGSRRPATRAHLYTEDAHGGRAHTPALSVTRPVSRYATCCSRCSVSPPWTCSPNCPASSSARARIKKLPTPRASVSSRAAPAALDTHTPRRRTPAHVHAHAHAHAGHAAGGTEARAPRSQPAGATTR